MSLTQRLEQDMKTALKNKDKTKLSVIRMVRSAIKNAEIERGRPLEEGEVLNVPSPGVETAQGIASRV